MNYTDEQMDELAALEMNQSQKRELMDLLDEFGDARFWVGRYIEAEGGATDVAYLRRRRAEHADNATAARNRIKELLFPNGGE